MRLRDCSTPHLIGFVKRNHPATCEGCENLRLSEVRSTGGNSNPYHMHLCMGRFEEEPFAGCCAELQDGALIQKLGSDIWYRASRGNRGWVELEIYQPSPEEAPFVRNVKRLALCPFCRSPLGELVRRS